MFRSLFSNFKDRQEKNKVIDKLNELGDQLNEVDAKRMRALDHLSFIFDLYEEEALSQSFAEPTVDEICEVLCYLESEELSLGFEIEDLAAQHDIPIDWN